MEYGYLGETFGWHLPRAGPGDEDPENLGDFWATGEETADDVLEWYREACGHADATIAALDLDSVGSVPHFPQPRRHVTLGAMMLRVLGEELRHGGHLDLVRELIDQTAPSGSARSSRWWLSHRSRLQVLAESFSRCGEADRP